MASATPSTFSGIPVSVPTAVWKDVNEYWSPEFSELQKAPHTSSPVHMESSRQTGFVLSPIGLQRESLELAGSHDSLFHNGYLCAQGDPLSDSGYRSQSLSLSQGELERSGSPALVPRRTATKGSVATKTGNQKKPAETYITLIGKALLNSSQHRLILADIYHYVLENYPYYRTAPSTWKNSIRHNLSVNECFVKARRAEHGRGFYWAIHPACIDAFKRGDFRRREARRLAKRMYESLTTTPSNLQRSTPQPMVMTGNHCVGVSNAPAPDHVGIGTESLHQVSPIRCHYPTIYQSYPYPVNYGYYSDHHPDRAFNQSMAPSHIGHTFTQCTYRPYTAQLSGEARGSMMSSTSMPYRPT